MTRKTALKNLLATHTEAIRALLPEHLHHLTPFKTEQFGPLTKYTLGQMPDGRWAMLHRLIRPDSGPPHCHPCTMHSFRLKGSYWERLYQNGAVQDVLRAEGSNHVIEADAIHLLTELPQGEVWTLVLAGPVVRKWKHYPELV